VLLFKATCQERMLQAISNAADQMSAHHTDLSPHFMPAPWMTPQIQNPNRCTAAPLQFTNTTLCGLTSQCTLPYSMVLLRPLTFASCAKRSVTSPYGFQRHMRALATTSSTSSMVPLHTQ
jgi:hypothetical protein